MSTAGKRTETVTLRIEPALLAWIDNQAKLRTQDRTAWITALLQRERGRLTPKAVTHGSDPYPKAGKK